MITETETAFLAVIRAFLTEEEAAPAEIEGLTEKQWNHLFVLASQHSLLAAVYDVVGTTPAFLQLPAELRGQVKMQAMQSIMQQVSRTAMFLADEKALEAIGVRPLVMKGIVCRSLYPKPDLRPSGDEDLLIQAKDFAVVDAYFIQNGFMRDKEFASQSNRQDSKRQTGNQSKKLRSAETDPIPEEMGYIHPKTGAFYEIHTTLFSRDSSAYGYLNHAFSNVFEHPAQIEVQGQTIFTLEETHHLFYLLCHSFKHFLHGGVGIRLRPRRHRQRGRLDRAPRLRRHRAADSVELFRRAGAAGAPVCLPLPAWARQSALPCSRAARLRPLRPDRQILGRERDDPRRDAAPPPAAFTTRARA